MLGFFFQMFVQPANLVFMFKERGLFLEMLKMNSSTNMTCHARIRTQQRGIPPLIQEWLLTYGAMGIRYGAQVRYFDKAARKVLKQLFGAVVIDRLGNLLNTYLVESHDATVITVGHRTQRKRRR